VVDLLFSSHKSKTGYGNAETGEISLSIKINNTLLIRLIVSGYFYTIKRKLKNKS